MINYIFTGLQIAQRVVRTILVVGEQKLPGFRPDLIESGKQPQLQHVFQIDQIEAFDKGILIRLSRFDDFDFGFVIPRSPWALSG